MKEIPCGARMFLLLSSCHDAQLLLTDCQRGGVHLDEEIEVEVEEEGAVSWEVAEVIALLQGGRFLA